MGSLIKMRQDAEDMREYAEALRRKARAIRELGASRKVLIDYIASHSEYIEAMRNAWRKALYGPSAMTQWFAENVRDEELTGIAGYPEAGVPVESGALQAALTSDEAEGAISDVIFSRDGKITFRYGAAPRRQYAPFTPGSNREKQEAKEFDQDSTYLADINAFYSEGGEGFYEIGLQEMSQSDSLRDCWLEIGNIMNSAARAFIAERSK